MADAAALLIRLHLVGQCRFGEQSFTMRLALAASARTRDISAAFMVDLLRLPADSGAAARRLRPRRRAEVLPDAAHLRDIYARSH